MRLPAGALVDPVLDLADLEVAEGLVAQKAGGHAGGGIGAGDPAVEGALPGAAGDYRRPLPFPLRRRSLRRYPDEARLGAGPGSGPWQEKHCPERMGRMSRLKSMSEGAVVPAASPGRATARHQPQKQIPDRSSGMIPRGHPRIGCRNDCCRRLGAILAKRGCSGNEEGRHPCRPLGGAISSRPLRIEEGGEEQEEEKGG